jgi:hypothetical protein
MKAEAQRTAIAEFYGWEYGVANVGPCHAKVGGYWYGGRFHTRDPGEYPFPDYLNCLNAMAAVEKMLTEEQHRRFVAHLWILRPGRHLISTPPKDIASAVVSASASERAEALLRTIGKWVDDEG